MAEQRSHQEPRELRLADVLRFVVRNAALIIGCALAVTVVTAAVVLLLPRQYEASVTLVIVPPKFSSELKPNTLTVQGYQELLESDAVIAETKRKLVEAGVLEASDPLRLGDELESRIFVSRRAEETSLAPMLRAVASDDDPKRAAAIANTWAGVFLERTRNLMANTTSALVGLISTEYPKSRKDLVTLQDDHDNLADEQARKRNGLSQRWDEGIAKYEAETLSSVADYTSETQRLESELSSRRRLETRRIQLQSVRKAYAALQDEQAGVNAELQQKQLQLQAVRRQMKDTPEFLTLRKAITDDALWNALGGRGGEASGDLRKLADQSLVTQQLNPVYASVASRAAEIEMDVDALVPRAKQLEEQLKEMSGEIERMETSFSADNAALVALTARRDAGVEALKKTRGVGLEVMKRKRDAELDSLDRRFDSHISRLELEITNQRTLFSQLAKSYNEGLLAQAQQDVEDVRMAAEAVPPDEPLHREAAIKLALGLLGGLLLGVIVAAVREAAQTIKADPRD